MTRRMLVDAAHAEETRVVVADDNRLLDYDHESSTKKQIKGNFYLAKVTRVEPSLQAAFVDFGGNRHGFLAFNEIHPDYYKIPVEDREALLQDEADEESEEPEDPEGENGEAGSVEELGGDEIDDIERASDSQRRRVRLATRQYKIQEVIKRRQILLVQVVKEERGNKGAALTTYLSIAGRYCVLMPNTARGGGISRKITSPQHRKRLRTLLQELEVPKGMGVILRTAGVERSKAEIKRDYEYLRRQWGEIRDQTLESTAPALIHEEGNVITRALRDLYTREIEEILIDGDEAYKLARNLMKTMIPSHAKRIKKYEDPKVPMYHRYGIEEQLDGIHEQSVHLPSGGYIVLNSTEALVAIDVNSGRATRQRNIEQTALHTNLEAAEEVARQLRLRDLAGLIVIDFIDMEEHRNNSAVERKLKEAMRIDRARIQVGHISHFGLLELSRQRLRPSLVEASTHVCEVCGGAGVIRSTESMSLKILRIIEEEGIQKRASEVRVSLPTSIALYVLNQKRSSISDIEIRHDLKISIIADDTLITPDYKLERFNDDGAEVNVSDRPAPKRDGGRKNTRRGKDQETEPVKEQETKSDTGRSNGQAGDDRREDRNGEDRNPRRRRRSRRRRDDAPADLPETENADTVPSEASPTGEAPAKSATASEDGDEEAREGGRRRRRRSRSGRRGPRDEQSTTEASADVAASVEAGENPPPDASATDNIASTDAANDDASNKVSENVDAAPSTDEEPAPKRRARRRPRRTAKSTAATAATDADSKPETVDAPIFEADRADAEAQETRDSGPAEIASSDRTKTESPGTSAVTGADNNSEAAAANGNGADAGRQSESNGASDQSVSPPPAPVDKTPKRRGWWNKVTG